MRVLAVAVFSLVTLTACSSDEGPKVPAVSPAVDLGVGQHTLYNLSVASGGGVVAVAWNDYDEEAAVEAPQVVVSSDGGASFAEPVAVDPSDPYVAYPQVAVSGDATIFVGVTLYEENESDGRPGLYRSDDKGATFELVADLVDGPRVYFSEVGTSVAVSPDGETVLMSWTTPGDTESPATHVAVVSQDGGVSFGSPIELSAETGGGRARAFFDEDGAGVVATEHIPLPDAPEPTPANPNPVTFTPQATLWPFENGTFGDGRALTAAATPALDQGPGASGRVVAWWEPSGDAAALRAAVNAESGASASDVLAAPLRVPANVEVVSDSGGTWFLTMDIPDIEGVKPAPLVLARQRDDGPASIVSAFTAEVTRSGEEFDLASVGDETVLIVWFDDGTIRSQRISG